MKNTQSFSYIKITYYSSVILLYNFVDILVMTQDSSNIRYTSSCRFEYAKLLVCCNRLMMSSEKNHIPEPAISKSLDFQLHTWIWGDCAGVTLG